MKKLFIIIISCLFLQTAFSQCNPDRHSTSWYDGWVSCMATQSPNPARGISHWIMYNFNEPYSLSTSTIWNSNDPAHLDYGIQGYTVDYSSDGLLWTSLGTFSAEKANGSPFYEGIEGPDFNKAVAQYVLITALSNYGGSCYGLSEVKFDLGSGSNGIFNEAETSMVIYPNPFTNKFTIKFFREGTERLNSVTIFDLTGRIVYFNQISIPVDRNEVILDNQEMKLVPGIYTIEIKTDQSMKTMKIVKM